MQKIVGENDYKFFKELFDTLDVNKNGSLDLKELELALKHTANRPDKVNFYMELTDDDGNGSLSFNEFMNLIIISQCDFDDVENSIKVFKSYDENKNGKLEKDEVKNCMEELGLDFGDKFDDFFKVLDMDNSGFLNKVEFYMMIEGLRRNIDS
jgi:Ca2+-binding EF-hand superfamily protein